MKTDLLMRSLMFVPSHNEKLLRKAAMSDADVLLLDLEDSCQPSTNKILARELVLRFIDEGIFGEKILIPRINERTSGEMLKDITSLASSRIYGFMYPKATKGEDIYFFGKLLEVVEREKSLEIGSLKILPLIETTGSIFNLQSIVKSCENRVIGLAFGHLDYISDVGGVMDLTEDSFQVARTLCAAAARSCGVIAIDTIHPEGVHDLVHLEQRIIQGKKLGYQGMLSLNPGELPLINAHYSPTDEERIWAQDIVLKYEQSEKMGLGVAIVDGKFVGPPLYKKALEILKFVEKLKKK